MEDKTFIVYFFLLETQVVAWVAKTDIYYS